MNFFELSSLYRLRRCKIRSVFTLLILLVVVAESGLVLAAESAAETPDYARQIQPILTKYCVGCHSDDEPEGKLSLASFEALRKGGEKGAVITPEHPELSRLIRMIKGQTEPVMPPKDEARPKEEEIAALEAWITAGAKGPAGGVAQPWLVTPQIPLTAPQREFISASAIHPGGDIVAWAKAGKVELQSLSEKKTLHELLGLPGSVNGVNFSKDGSFVVAAAGEPGLFGAARIWNVGDGSQVQEFRGHKDSLYSACFSPDGKIVATSSYDHDIKLWDVESGKELKTLTGHNGPVFEIAFRPDGKLLASASGDRTVKLWDVATGQRLDTLKESTKELYALAFDPTGSKLAAAGVDNRIRVWTISPEAKEGTNPLIQSQFAHEQAVLRLVWSADGRTLASTGEEGLIKIWNANGMTIRKTFEKQPDWVLGLSLTPTAETLLAGRLDGSIGSYPVPPPSAENASTLTPAPELPPAIDYRPQPEVKDLPRVAEVEPNQSPQEATALNSIPAVATGTIQASTAGSPPDADLFRFQAAAGEQWIIETRAAQNKSLLDSKIEVLSSDGQPIPRLLLRAVRDSELEFRGGNSDQRGFRVRNWEEMLLNEYVYVGGDVMKLFQQRRGPDADGQFYPESGNRYALFETTARAHALGEPAFMVVPYPVGTQLADNGLPIFTLYYENDDDGYRRLGKDSRLTFVPPSDGDYLIRVTDVRGFGSDQHKYELIVRRPVPGFKVTLGGANATVPVGSGKEFTVKATRVDNFQGPIRVELTNLPAGYQATSPIEIEAGLNEARGVLNAAAGATQLSDEEWQKVQVTATAEVVGKTINQPVNNLGNVKRADRPKLVPFLELVDAPSATLAEKPDSTVTTFPDPAELTIQPGGTVTARLRVERDGFKGRVPFEVQNLPHGVIVDDIGLSGILIVEGTTERTMTLRAEPWVKPQTRLFHAVAKVEGEQVTLPMILHVK